MNNLHLILVILITLAMTGCAVSKRPEEQSTWGVVVGSTTGQYNKFLNAMQQRLDALTERTKGVDQLLDDAKAQLFFAKRDLETYEISERERDQLKTEISKLESQTNEIDQLNTLSKALIVNRESEIAEKEIEQEKLQSEIESVEQQMQHVEKQANTFEDGIKRIAALRARQALES